MGEPEVPDEIQAKVAATRRYVVEQLRSTDDPSDSAVADKLDAGLELNEHEQVILDAVIHGTGFMVDGKRVAPDRVQIVRWDGP